ncbi:GSCFA domain-containing protein [Psychroflexus sp. CAK8W]|uniref:GSCFA domain-containing protein n=1 Tax=Psychroflexus longus TaxID=2873596 RepID=A0ABS7XF68_9FLAO|nr:GSCFA domain-containing protein [Psychroflexus longus]MBZ9777340.1 GSCFA domain-containing protein [Psychroflexus longus]
MKLTTEVPVNISSHPIDYNSSLLCLGSCFAEHISSKLDFFKFKVTSSPFGILFHPEAILNVVEKAVNDEDFTEDDVFQHNEKWHSFFAHSRLSRNSSAEILAVLNSAKKELKVASEQATHIIITLGTSFIYRHRSTQQGVANCHKLPQDRFEKQLTSITDLKKILKRLVNSFENIQPDVKLVFTVSPVRHIKDGIIENNRSKSHLLTALHLILEEKTSKKLSYFPSYELMMDELRDYRFYDRDLIHPNALAVDLIWERFKMNFISQAIYLDMTKVEKLQKSFAHRQSESKGEAFEKLKAYQYKFKKELTQKYPFMRFPKL